MEEDSEIEGLKKYIEGLDIEWLDEVWLHHPRRTRGTNPSIFTTSISFGDYLISGDKLEEMIKRHIETARRYIRQGVINEFETTPLGFPSKDTLERIGKTQLVLGYQSRHTEVITAKFILEIEETPANDNPEDD